MPSPTAALSTYRPDIGGALTQFDLAMDRQGFIAHRVLPVFEVAVSAGVFGKIPIAQLLQNRETARSSGAGYSRGSYKFATDTFATYEHGAEEPVDEREAALYANYFDAEVIAAQRALDVVLRNAEKRVAAMVYNATTWAGSALTTGITNEWDDSGNAVPITDVEAAVRKVWSGTGLWPNALIINRHVFRNLRLCNQIIDRISSDGSGDKVKAEDITVAQLAACFDLDYILVAGAAKNTADEGQTAAIDKIWSDEYAMVCRIATTNDIQEPCLGRTFHWGADGSTIGGTIESYDEVQTRSRIHRVRHDVHEKILYTECAHLLSNVTT